VTPCSLITAYEYFEGLFCLRLQVQNKCGEDIIGVYGHTARTKVTQTDGREVRGNPVKASSRCEQTIWEQQSSNWIFTPTTCALKMEAAYSFEWLVYTQSALWMLHFPVEVFSNPLFAFMASYRTNFTFTFTTVPFPAGHCTVCSASTCAVPGFASRCAAQVSAITASCYKWSRPHGGSGRGALSEEGTAKHWYPSR